MLLIPVTSAPDNRMQVQLGGQLLGLRTYYVPAAAGWHLDISDAAGELLAEGLALVPAVNVLASRPELTRTIGQFRVLAFEAGSENSRDDAIDPLWWFAPGEWEAMAPAQLFGSDLPFSAGDLYSPIPGVPPASVPIVVQQLEEVTQRLYDLVNTDFYPRLS